MLSQELPRGERNITSYLSDGYSFLDSLRLGGTGSPRITYQEGIPLFDAIAVRNLDINYCNFQAMREGLAIRILKGGEGAIAGIRFAELVKLKLTITPIRIRSMYGYKIVHRARIEITIAGSVLLFVVEPPFYPSWKRFLRFVPAEKIIEEMLPKEDDLESRYLWIFSWLSKS